jgi:F-type H+-transporting ATPase subunit gamma
MAGALMPTYTRLKQEIGGIQAVAEAVKATEEVSASRIHRLRRISQASRDYIADLQRLLRAFGRHHALTGGQYFSDRPAGERLLILLGFDRGLTGGLDNRLLEAFLKSLDRYDQVVAVGERLGRLLAAEGIRPIQQFSSPSDQIADAEVAAIERLAIDSFETGRCRSVDVLYARFDTLAVQEPEFSRFLPLTPERLRGAIGGSDAAAASPAADDSAPPAGWPLFLPNPAAVADSLVRTYIKAFFRSRLTESKLSELAARTVTCEHAGQQADDQVQRMRHAFFKERRRELSQRQISSFFAHRATVR